MDMSDLRRMFKTNMALSGVDRTIRNAIFGHATHLAVQDSYIHVSDERLIEAVDNTKFDYGTNPAQIGEVGKLTKNDEKSRSKEKRRCGHIA